MKFVSVRDLRTNTAQLRKELQAEGEIIVTANGKPFAIMTGVTPETVEEELRAIRSARAQEALRRIRRRAKAKGLDRLTIEEIDSIIAKARRERRRGK